jgi:hypothetical protein
MVLLVSMWMEGSLPVAIAAEYFRLQPQGVTTAPAVYRTLVTRVGLGRSL